MSSDQIKVGAAIVVMGVAGVLIYKNVFGDPGHGENMPEGTFWICGNESCNNEFNMSLSKVRSLRNADGLVPCPKCNEWRVTRGHVCDSCKRVYEPVGHGGKPDNCPHCGEPVPMDEEVKRMMAPGPG